MFNVDELLTCSAMPAISDVSLSLYKSFYENKLMPLVFSYDFFDGSSIQLEFPKARFRHLLGIQHIDHGITDDNIFQKLDDGLSFADWESDKRKHRKYNDMKDRIALFSCSYSTLKYGRIFYCPGRVVSNSPNVKLDYIILRQINNRGLNFGIRNEGGCHIPITIMPSRSSNIKKYVNEDKLKVVSGLTIKNKYSQEVIEKLTYADSFIMSDTNE